MTQPLTQPIDLSNHSSGNLMAIDDVMRHLNGAFSDSDRRSLASPTVSNRYYVGCGLMECKIVCHIIAASFVKNSSQPQDIAVATLVVIRIMARRLA